MLRGLLAWSLKHGHFLIMGGFHLVEPGTSIAPGTEQLEVPPDSVQPTVTASGKGNGADTEKGHVSCNTPKLEEGRVTILTLEMLEELVKDPGFEIQVTEDEITDRSKGDAVSKIIFILQSSWFIVQCIGRCIQGLSLTHLELSTLALASLNGMTFILWWDKPLGAQTPVRVYLKRQLTNAERNVEGVSGFFAAVSIPSLTLSNRSEVNLSDRS